ncbi:15745_t:CDS:2, partial [Cetraspora pellucida]
FEQHQETVSIQATKFQDMYNNLNITFQEIISNLSMQILKIKDKNSIHYKITSHLYSKNIDEAAFKFNLEKPS